MLRINVLGLGYVGCVSAACLANSGHQVTGVDVDPLKVRLINQGRSPVVEPGLDKAVRQAVQASRLKAAESFGPADVSLICVGTPSRENGSLDLQYVRRVAELLGAALRENPAYHVISVRSTVLPGTLDEVVIPALEESSGRKAGRDFGVSMNPEFMREGSSLKDYYSPPFTVIGELDQRSGETTASLYRDIEAPLIRTPLRVAEMVKYASNSFHALKVCFANEVGNLCKQLGIDSHQVMDVVCQDTKLNLSPYYLEPGFAFGGSCLPKDVRALQYKARTLDLRLPVMEAILESNRRQVDAAFRMVKRSGKKRVGLVGLSFKAGSDDLRESPMVELVEKLIGKGFSVSIYDREVSLARIFGANRRYVDKVIPHVSSLMKETIEEVIRDSDLIVVTKKDEEYTAALRNLDGSKRLLDLVRAFPPAEASRLEGYEGICW